MDHDYGRRFTGFETQDGKLGKKILKVINTPDLPFDCKENLTEFTKECMTHCSPGPHVLLLLLDPEKELTAAEKKRVFAVLEHFSQQWFDHSLILILKHRNESFREEYMKSPIIKDFISKCRYRYLKMGNIERQELLTRIGQIVKENCGEHLIYEEKTAELPSDHQSQRQWNRFKSIVSSLKSVKDTGKLPTDDSEKKNFTKNIFY